MNIPKRSAPFTSLLSSEISSNSCRIVLERNTMGEKKIQFELYLARTGLSGCLLLMSSIVSKFGCEHMALLNGKFTCRRAAVLSGSRPIYTKDLYRTFDLIFKVNLWISKSPTTLAFKEFKDVIYFQGALGALNLFFHIKRVFKDFKEAYEPCIRAAVTMSTNQLAQCYILLQFFFVILAGCSSYMGPAPWIMCRIMQTLARNAFIQDSPSTLDQVLLKYSLFWLSMCLSLPPELTTFTRQLHKFPEHSWWIVPCQ